MKLGRSRTTVVGWELTPRAGTATPRQRSRSKSPKKSSPRYKQAEFLYDIGTLGTSFRSVGLGDSTDRSLTSRHNGTFSTLDYTKKVRRTFRNKPKLYKKFASILADVQNPDTDKMDIIKKVAVLFDGYPDLILGFNAFLPDGYSIEMQDDAVIVKVFDSDRDTMRFVDTGHIRSEPSLSGTLDSSRSLTWTGSLTGQSMAYVQKVKESFKHKPETYKKFRRVMNSYHEHDEDLVDTMYDIIDLFQHHPDLVLGFNTFLPDGCSVHMSEKSAYVVEYPNGDGSGKEFSKITIKCASKRGRGRIKETGK